LGNTVTALKCVKRAIDLEESNAEYWYILGDIQEKNNLIDKAIKSYEKVCELEPTHPEIWLDFSNLYAEQKKLPKAIEIIQTGIELLDDNIEFKYRLVVYLLKSGKSKEAYELLEKALTTDYSAHEKLFEYQEDLKKNSELMRIIESFNESK